MIITISGLPGSGKSTVGKILAKELGYEFFSVGDLRGKWATERKMTIRELNKLGEKEDWTDKKADEYQAGLAKKGGNLIIDGRLSFHFIPDSYKVFMKVDPDEGAKRILGDKRTDEDAEDFSQLKKDLDSRVKSDEKRYKAIYNVDFLNMDNYDLVIDTTKLSPAQVAEEIKNGLEKGQ